MKKLYLISLLLLLSSCGDPLIHGSKVYDCYGWIDEDQVKEKGVAYKSVTGNVVWSVIASETIFVPVWLLGYNLYCPIQVVEENKNVE